MAKFPDETLAACTSVASAAPHRSGSAWPPQPKEAKVEIAECEEANMLRMSHDEDDGERR